LQGENLRVAGVLLAAGLSRRMGRNKMLLPIEGVSLLRRAARVALDAGLDPLFVVLGHDPEAARRELKGLACETVFNPDYARGIGTSLRVGIGAIPSGARAAMMVLADMPRVTAAMIETIAARYRNTGAPLVISEYAGIEAPPVLFDRALFGELLEADAEESGKRVLRRHGAVAVRVPWPREALADIDLREDYARLSEDLWPG
jgi:molybdenum cofactor cytidylyltransferase